MMLEMKRFEHQDSPSFFLKSATWESYIRLIQEANENGQELQVKVFVGGYVRRVTGRCVLFNETLKTFLCGHIVVRYDEVI
ncbi:hypothetical protein ACRW9N_10730 [Listeria aquatica]|uniref:hypothetical protein n=1 Tax=Listeria aquatica TaxID=1494960 RepID=UPI003EF46FAA